MHIKITNKGTSKLMKQVLPGILSTLILLPSLAAASFAGSPALAAGEIRTNVSPNGNISTALTQTGPSDRLELEAFLDKLMTQNMAEYHVAGAAVSVVKDGKLMLAKGYGYANLEKGIPVDPEQTGFRIGSGGKVFTWTAVMQLVEQGKLDLEEEINTYLDFRIPDTFPEPIRLKHLLTHTSGFEQRLFGSAVPDPDAVLPGREFLISHMSARMRPPGVHASYSNYNAMLAGYIIARVSGQPYDEYMQEHIFNPLGMVHSTARLPIPPELAAQASVGYTYADGEFHPLPGYSGSPAGTPSGMHQLTVTDMARFMIAHLQGGRYSDANIPEAHIMKETTMHQMHSPLYTPDPRLRSTTHGLFDMSFNGQRTIGHRGYLPPMHGLMMLLPDQNLGVYVVYNTESAAPLADPHTGFQKALFDHYYPASAVEPILPPADFTERAGRFVGSYRLTEPLGTTIFKFAALMGAPKISDPGDGTLLFGKSRFVEVSPLYFRQVDGPDGIAFREDDRGRITHMFTDLVPYAAFEKLDWYETRDFYMALILGSVLMFLSVIAVSAVRLIRHLRPGGDRKPEPRSARIAVWNILAISLLNLLFLAGFVLGMPEFMQNVLLDLPSIVKISLGMGVLAAVLTAGALVYAVVAWKNSYWSIASRVYFTLVTIAAVAFVWVLNYWNLLGWRV